MPPVDNFDLHNHSRFSDGLLSPTQLIELAARTGADAIALTDHDTTDGLAEAQTAARRLGIGFIPGVEISVSWGDTTLHVVGLMVDPESPSLARGLEAIHAARKAARGQAVVTADQVAGCAAPVVGERDGFGFQKGVRGRGPATGKRGPFCYN